MVGQQQQAGTALSERSKSARARGTPRQQIREPKATTRRQFSAEEKIRTVMDGMLGEEPVSVIWRREGIHATYCRWLRDGLEAMKARLRGDTRRQTNRCEVAELKRENEQLKQLVADYTLQVTVLKSA